MEFYATTVNGTPLVGGLEWRAIAGPAGSVDKEIRAYARDLEAKLHVDFKNVEGAVLCGFLQNDLRSELPKNALALPVVLAGVPDIDPDCVLVIQNGDTAIIAALLNGAPAPGFDGQGSLEDMVAAAQRFIRVAPQAVTVYGNCEELQPEPMELADVLAKSTTLKKAKLHGLAMSPAMRIGLLAVILLAVGAGAKFGYDYKEKLRKIAAARLANVDPNVSYGNNVKPLFGAAIPVKQALPALSDMLANIVMSQGGWDLVDIVCQKEGCVFSWKNMEGTNKTFVVPPQVTDLRYSPKGDVVSYQMAFIKPLPTGLVVEKPLTVEQLWRDVIGDFQELAGIGIERSFGTPADFGLPPGIMGKPTLIYKEGTYSLSGPWYLRDAISKLPDASTFEAVHIAIDSEQNINFKLSGKYYVQ